MWIQQVFLFNMSLYPFNSRGSQPEGLWAQRKLCVAGVAHEQSHSAKQMFYCCKKFMLSSLKCEGFFLTPYGSPTVCARLALMQRLSSFLYFSQQKRRLKFLCLRHLSSPYIMLFRVILNYSLCTLSSPRRLHLCLKAPQSNLNGIMCLCFYAVKRSTVCFHISSYILKIRFHRVE